MQFQGKAFRTDKYSVLDAACVQMQFLYDLLVEVGPSLGWENPVLGALSLLVKSAWCFWGLLARGPSGARARHPRHYQVNSANLCRDRKAHGGMQGGR